MVHRTVENNGKRWLMIIGDNIVTFPFRVEVFAMIQKCFENPVEPIIEEDFAEKVLQPHIIFLLAFDRGYDIPFP